jgi:hypothetical protein
VEPGSIKPVDLPVKSRCNAGVSVRWRRFVEDIMSSLNRILAVALIAGGVSSLAGSANAVPLSASLALRDAATPAVQTVQWRRGWGGFGFGLAAGALIGAAVTAPYWGGYGGYGGYYGGCYGCYGYGYPAYAYSYAPSYYSYGYAPAYYSYSYAYPSYYAYPRIRYRAALYRPLRYRW